jgi:OmpA-OmpF porin, OOP family
MRLIFFALCMILGLHGDAQNLVFNPSFEELKPRAIIVACEFMQYSTYFDEKVRFWTTSRNMTPDLLRAAENCPWLSQAHTGEQCLGIINYLPANDIGDREDYRETVRGRLREPLKPGERYKVECWVREEESIIRKHLAKVYAPTTPVMPAKAGNLGFYFYVRNPLPDHVPQVNFTEVIETNGKWVKLSTEFVPDEPFEYFIMGNFFPHRLTATNLSAEQNREVELKNGKIPYGIDKVKRAAYLCIDDVSVELAAGRPNLERALLVDRKFTFSAAVLFDTGKSDLRKEAGPELDSLVHFLQKYPGLRIGISGHTDDVGSDESNQDLSDRRARAVQQYLIEHGIAEGRLRYKGFGESKPVASNLTDAGRQANRRVECVVLKTE